MKVSGSNQFKNDYDQYLMISLGTGQFSRHNIGIAPEDYSLQGIADFKSDGLSDIYIARRRDGKENHRVRLSKGSLTFDTVDKEFGSSSSFLTYHSVGSLGDFDDDGLTDFYRFTRKDENLKSSENTRDIFQRFTGDGQFERIFRPAQVMDIEASGSVTGSIPVNYKISGSGDFNGDGLPDIYAFKAVTGDNSNAGDAIGDGKDIFVLAQKRDPSLISAIVNGMGNRVEVSYKPLTDPSVYTRYNNAVYPVQDVTPSSMVVAQVKSDNGVGGQNSQTYTYEGLKVHQKGLGSLGFARMLVTDDETGIVTDTAYNQQWENRFHGLLGFTRTIAPNGVKLEEKEIFWANRCCGGPTEDTKHCFRYSPQTGTRNKDLNGADLGTTTENSTYDDYGFVTRLEATTTLGAQSFTKITDNIYTNDTANWILGRLTTATVTHKAAGQVDMARTSSFTYAPGTGLLASEIIEPGHPLSHTKTYVQNGFGAVTAITETWGSSASSGIAATSRTTSYTYDSKVRFKLTETNPLGYVQANNYHPVHGLLVSSTGPNALTTAWTYDAFGQPLEETRADGTKTRTYRYLCDANTPCPQYGFYVTLSAADGGPVAAVYKDRLHRVLRESVESLDGRLIDSDSRHDTRGQVIAKSEPFLENETALWTAVQYDILGRPLITTKPDASTESASYDGLTAVSTNGLGQTKTVVSDVLGRMVSARDDAGSVITYQYDAIGQMTAIYAPGGVTTTMFYDIRGAKIGMTDPDKGTWGYRYNALGLLVEQTDAKGQLTAMTYDVLGRMLTRTDDAGGANPGSRMSSWVYDTGPKGVGKLASSSGYGYAAAVTYDGLGRPSLSSETMDGTTYVMTTG